LDAQALLERECREHSELCAAVNLRANLPLACMGSACMPPHRQVRALAAMHSLGEVEKLEEGLLSKLTEVQVEHPRATPLPHGRNRPHVSVMAAVWP
jgi:hypothetical protein